MRNYNNYKDIFSISDYSRVRKHRQIINSVLSATTMGSLKMNDKLPSVNELAIDYNISRDTVVRAYAFLKENDIIDSIPGKGYYVKSTTNGYKVKVFLLFNSLSPHMKKIYDAFAEAIQDTALIDFYVYQNNYNQFKKHILHGNSKEYSHFVLATNFDENAEDYVNFIKNEVPVEKLILLNRDSESLGDEVACVYENLEVDFFKALEELESYLKKYKGIKLILPKTSKIPNAIKRSFVKFCNEYGYGLGLIEDFNSEAIEKNIVYVDFEDDNSLVKLIKKIQSTDLVLGENIGLLSYDDNPLKELLAGGITVITQVFEKIGYQAAKMILNNGNKQILDPFNVIIRKSL